MKTIILTIADVLALSMTALLIGALRLLPQSCAVYLAFFIIRTFLLFMPRSIPVAMRNLEHVFPEISVAERKTILKKSFWVFAENLVAYAKLPCLTTDNVQTRYDLSESQEAISNIRRRGHKGGIIVGAMHFGPFEEVIQAYACVYEGSAILARGFGLPRLDAWWNRRRELHGCQMFSRKGGYREMNQRLVDRQIVTLLFDQNVKKNHAVFVDFFGTKASSTKAIGLASIRTQSPVIFIVGYKQPDGRTKTIGKVVTSSMITEGSVADRVAAIMQELHCFAEEVIRQHPEQWFWIHRRFKTRPKGETENFYSNI